MTTLNTMESTRTGLSGKWRLALWGTAAALLAVPAIAMIFTGEVNLGTGRFHRHGRLAGDAVRKC
ncbi:MAG: hypothetical protein R3E18_01020 [Sphingomonadaceae bacterium]|nr:hypothetical protein [Sphingomonadaceae bacterium]